MRIGVLSDTHDQLEIATQAVRVLVREGAETLVHCGDLTRPDIVRICSALPCVYAFGNHDADNIPELEHVIATTGGTCLGSGGVIGLGGRRVAIVHGHVGMKKLLATKPDFLLHGHVHAPADERVGSTRRICPGALHRAERLTVGLLDTEAEGLRILDLSEHR